ncbi:MAG: fasciclin domain-containing protein [Gemmatimonadetes bacterium]|nr:fasciclin domain-containing protein [Gemmatimonadota bacterium]NNF11862.1 fasciclin domain-containing protein [Gemmatimonadota bacterium]NNL31226.1 fasciclin domain-containing protein [Gemmatimonadota bacterium]
MFKKTFTIALAAAAVATASPADVQAQDGDIVAVAQAAGGFETLLAAATAADLVATLQSEGPFTVFAPTDEAFAKIPQAQLQALLEDKEALQKVLLYHVVPGRVAASQVVNLNTAETAAGQNVTILVENGSVKVDNANVVATDIQATNGIIHVIDQVILPEM